MNKVELLGRLVKDPDVRASVAGNGETSTVTKFTVAVDRRHKNADGQDTADFISCVAFGKVGENVGKYFTKGRQILIEGRIQTGSYTNKEGQKIFTTEVVVEEFDFVDKAPASGQGQAQPQAPSQQYQQQPAQPAPQYQQQPAQQNPFAGFNPGFQQYQQPTGYGR